MKNRYSQKRDKVIELICLGEELADRAEIMEQVPDWHFRWRLDTQLSDRTGEQAMQRGCALRCCLNTAAPEKRTAQCVGGELFGH